MQLTKKIVLWISDLACNPSPPLFCLFDIELKSNYAIHGFPEGRKCLELFQIPKIWEVFGSMSIPSGSNQFLSHTFPPLCPLTSTPRLETFGWLKHVKLNHWKGQREIKAASHSVRSSTSVYSSWLSSVCWGRDWTSTARKDWIWNICYVKNICMRWEIRGSSPAGVVVGMPRSWRDRSLTK